MENKIITQRLRRIEENILQKAIRYYTILSSINDLQMTEREIQLVAFTAVKGNISHPHNKEEFCRIYSSSYQTILNMTLKLKRLGVLIKDNSKIKVNPKILLDFNNDIVLQIILNGQTAKPVS